MPLVMLMAVACGSGRQTSSDSERLMGEALEAIGSHDLTEAEQKAYNAAILSMDSTEMADALTLLSLVYTLEGQERKARLVLDVLPREQSFQLVRLQDQAHERAKHSERLLFGVPTGVLCLLAIGTVWWYRRRERIYQQKVDELMTSMAPEELHPALRPDLARTKEGVDVLYAIQHDDNISQMGRRQQLAVSATLQLVEPALAAALEGVELTPKETFYCIMQYYGKSEQQKARSFCCSEQALRSTKSRLGKKLDLNLLKHADFKQSISTNTINA